MAFRIVLLIVALATANAGLLGSSLYGAAPALAYGAAGPAIGSTYYGNYGSPALAYGSAPALAYGGAVAPAVTTQHQNILRSYGNLGQVSTYSRTIDTPYSSSSKSDVRVSNPGLRTIAAAPAISYGAAPALSYGAAPALSYGAAPALSYSAAPALGYGASSVLRSAVAAPVLHSAVAAPALSYGAAPLLSSAAVGPALSYGARAIGAPALGYSAGLGRLGVAYSAAPIASHVNYASTYANYGW